eukprot:3116877-Rhodomonas_salina.2
MAHAILASTTVRVCGLKIGLRETGYRASRTSNSNARNKTNLCQLSNRVQSRTSPALLGPLPAAPERRKACPRCRTAAPETALHRQRHHSILAVAHCAQLARFVSLISQRRRKEELRRKHRERARQKERQRQRQRQRQSRGARKRQQGRESTMHRAVVVVVQLASLQRRPPRALW